MITDFIVVGNHAFSTVEQDKFKEIINKGFPYRCCLARKTLTSRILSNATDLKNNLMNELTSDEVKYICVTADCWSVYKR